MISHAYSPGRVKSNDRNKLTGDRIQTDREPTATSDLSRHNDFVTKWGLGKDGSGYSKMFLLLAFSANWGQLVRGQFVAVSCSAAVN